MQLDYLNSFSNTISSGFPEKMVLFDCETTGGNPKYHRIIEVGLIIIEKGCVIERWQSFVNPHLEVPELITRITGINTKMIEDAPSFMEIAHTLEKFTSDRIFIAHNAKFDFGFLKNEFDRVGIKFNPKILCSVKLSRGLYPNIKGHGLSAIIKRFDLPIMNRHRALDDAEMILEFFMRISGIFDEGTIKTACDSQYKRPSIPPNLAHSEVEKLPKKPGVYYFYDKNGVLLYVGKSINIFHRVMSHFYSDHKNSKDFKLNLKISHINFTETPSDFSAQLLESREIKNLNPIYNHRLKKSKYLYQIKTKTNSFGYKELDIDKIITKNEVQADRYGLFRSFMHAKKQILKLSDEHNLCLQLSCLEKNNNKPCFRTQLNKCGGACSQKENKDDYNARVDLAMVKYQMHVWPYPGPILIEERNSDHKSLKTYHLVNNWIYIGEIKNEDDFYNYGLSGYLSPVLTIPSERIKTLNQFEFDLDTYHILVRFLLNKVKNDNLTVFSISKIIDNQK